MEPLEPVEPPEPISLTTSGTIRTIRISGTTRTSRTMRTSGTTKTNGTIGTTRTIRTSGTMRTSGTIRTSGTTRTINADGRKLTPLGTATASLDIGIITVEHALIVVEKLSTPVILGCDFLTTHDVMLDFKAGTFHTTTSTQEGKLLLQLPHSCMLVLDDDHPQACHQKPLYQGTTH